MNDWRFADTVELVSRAYGWMICVTLPAVSLASAVVLTAQSTVRYDSSNWSEAVWGTLLTVLLVDVVAAVVALVGAAISLPFTHVLGRCLRRIRSRAVQVPASAALAAVLAWCTGWATAEWWAPQAGIVSGTVIGVAGASAAAIARWRQLRASASDDGPDVGVTAGLT